MSYAIHTDISCDAPRCRSRIRGPDNTDTPQKTKAKRRAQSEGWTVEGYRAICPKCKADGWAVSTRTLYQAEVRAG